MKACELTLKSFCQILLFSLVVVCINAQQNPYEDVANQVGIDHTYIINNSGGGVSFVDFDMDGKDDITLATGKDEEIHFYRNIGNGFELVDLGIENIEQAKSVLWADIDNDGDKDFYVTAFAGTNHLYENIGNLNFERITVSAGLPIDSLKSFGAIWGDYNRDGYLDLYYTERPNAGSGTVQRNRLFKNLGGNEFVEVSNEVNAADEGRLPFCAAFFDYNDDKWPDIYIANDRQKRNTLLQNNNGVFEDVSVQCNAAIEIDAMNVGIADIDNNGLSDIYVTNTPSGSALLKCTVEEGTNHVTYSDEADERGIGYYGVGWGANFLDADNDGWQDLYVCGMLSGSDVISNEMYINDKTGHFNQTTTGFVGDTVTSFVNAIGDFNNDGYPDIMVSNSNYYNSQLWTSDKGDNNYIKIELQGVKSNRDGIGSKIEVFSDGLKQMKFTHSGIAFMGQNSNSQIFGIGSATTVDSVKITWPTGHIDLIEELTINEKVHIVEGQSTSGIISVDEDVMLSTSIEEHENKSNFEIWPNPANEMITIESSTSIITIDIIDISGNLNFTTTQKEIDISHLLPGVYLTRAIFSDGKTHSARFLKI